MIQLTRESLQKVQFQLNIGDSKSNENNSKFQSLRNLSSIYVQNQRFLTQIKIKIEKLDISWNKKKSVNA